MLFKDRKSFLVRFVLTLVLLSGALATTQVRAQAAVYRVTPAGAVDPGCGGSWSNPCDLQYALTTLVSAGDEVWVAAGTYKPTTGTDRAISFTLQNGVALYGGFGGAETLRSQRAPQSNLTILSGDIGVVGDNSDNSYHVVVGSNTDNTAILDGFTVTGGNADPDRMRMGGGMLNENGSPTVSNVIFNGNAAGIGGGMYNGGAWGDPAESNPVLTNVVFSDNSAIEGGGMENQFTSNPSLTNVTFSNNSALRSGGGMTNYENSSPTLIDVTFSGNTAGMGGGIMNWSYSSPTLTNVTFYENSAEMGGGMANDSDSIPTLQNVTLSGNQASQGGGVYNGYSSSANIANSILYGNTEDQIYDYEGVANVTYSIVQGGYDGTGNLDADPLLGPLQDNGGFTQIMALGAGSPAIDAGSNANCPATDQRGAIRPHGAACDIGAYEFGAGAGPTPTPTVRMVSSNGAPLDGKPVYAFNGSTYTGRHGVTNANGEVAISLPDGDYRFRVDVDGTQFWSGPQNHCSVPGCLSVVVTVPEPVVVTVQEPDGMLPMNDLNVYAFNGATYTGYHGRTDQNGQLSLRLPAGSYRFRADFNGTQFWSDTANHCDVPDCESADVTVSKPVVVAVLDPYGMPKEGLKVYAFTGSAYTGYSVTTDGNGWAVFTLPFGNYRFRADFNGTQFWSDPANHCEVSGCEYADITVSQPVAVNVLDTYGRPGSGLKVYAFNGSTYTGYSQTTGDDGQAFLTLPFGNYHFRVDFNGTQFWSDTVNHCEVSGCEYVAVTISKPVTVSVLDTDGAVKAGVKVYAFHGSTYTGYNKTTGDTGEAVFTLPLGNYRFRADLNGTQFWSDVTNHCELPGCEYASVTVSQPVTVSVLDTQGTPRAGLKVYAFNGSTYTGYSKTTNADGQAIFTLPLGSYRFRADDAGVQYWSEPSNHCSLPGCLSASVTITE